MTMRKRFRRGAEDDAGMRAYGSGKRASASPRLQQPNNALVWRCSSTRGTGAAAFIRAAIQWNARPARPPPSTRRELISRKPGGSCNRSRPRTTLPNNVRCWEQRGKHLLAVRISHVDPDWTFSSYTTKGLLHLFSQPTLHFGKDLIALGQLQYFVFLRSGR
jgi:hypothetical protein